MSKKSIDENTKKKQLTFVDMAIASLQSFREELAKDKLFIEDGTVQDEYTVATEEAADGNNIYIRIDYQRYEQPKKIADFVETKSQNKTE
ncbi:MULTISPECIES: hypothetical protein [Enterococcus]|uniref:hypothetical protein n=1 Tax=Enterococcus TaxID=1350 RepID=UPI0028923CE9|nr:hypothetical protein [Enterococcus thailandicus]MDT2793464.1 hypothetical protein [Enterococcus thailandicus]